MSEPNSWNWHQRVNCVLTNTSTSHLNCCHVWNSNTSDAITFELLPEGPTAKANRRRDQKLYSLHYWKLVTGMNYSNSLSKQAHMSMFNPSTRPDAHQWPTLKAGILTGWGRGRLTMLFLLPFVNRESHTSSSCRAEGKLFTQSAAEPHEWVRCAVTQHWTYWDEAHADTYCGRHKLTLKHIYILRH